MSHWKSFHGLRDTFSEACHSQRRSNSKDSEVSRLHAQESMSYYITHNLEDTYSSGAMLRGGEYQREPWSGESTMRGFVLKKVHLRGYTKITKEHSQRKQGSKKWILTEFHEQQLKKCGHFWFLVHAWVFSCSLIPRSGGSMLRLLKLGMFHISTVRGFPCPKCIILRGVRGGR